MSKSQYGVSMNDEIWELTKQLRETDQAHDRHQDRSEFVQECLLYGMIVWEAYENAGLREDMNPYEIRSVLARVLREAMREEGLDAGDLSVRQRPYDFEHED